MEEFISLINSLGIKLSELGTKLKKAQELFPGNALVKKVEEFITKMAREPSILSQDEEMYGTDEFLSILAERERILMEAIEKEKQGKGKGKETYNPQNAFDLGISLTPPEFKTPSPTNPAYGAGSSSSAMHQTPSAKGVNLELNLGQSPNIYEHSEVMDLLQSQTYDADIERILNPGAEYVIFENFNKG